VDELERNPREPLTIRSVSRRFGIKSRRLYDVFNVFISLGCCQKLDADGYAWHGLNQAPGRLREVRQLRGADDPRRSLADLFPDADCVGIANLTSSFLLLYYVVKMSVLDIRVAACLFAKGNNRFKPTLCKLYQISFVLCAVGITTRTASMAEIALTSDYLDFVVLPPKKTSEAEPASLEALLNHRDSDSAYIYRRRREMEETSSASPLKRRRNFTVGGAPDT
jgi:hypothetical protein